MFSPMLLRMIGARVRIVTRIGGHFESTVGDTPPGIEYDAFEVS